MISPFDYDPKYKSANENRIAELEAERERLQRLLQYNGPHELYYGFSLGTRLDVNARLSEIDSELQKIRNHETLKVWKSNSNF